MSYEWSTDIESVPDHEKAQMKEEDARFQADPAAGCRGIFYAALFSGIVFVISIVFLLYWWLV
ncbi:MAG: hypothetical protein ACK2T4_09135 [Candidatus Promineifilaceae bacterium]|jgi:hypothetical protein